MPRQKFVHPSLARIYKECETNNKSYLYFDESYTSPAEGFSENFYTLTGVKFEGNKLQDIRDDLTNIIGGTWWHSTEALHTVTGRKTFEELVAYFSD